MLIIYDNIYMERERDLLILNNNKTSNKTKSNTKKNAMFSANIWQRRYVQCRQTYEMIPDSINH